MKINEPKIGEIVEFEGMKLECREQRTPEISICRDIDGNLCSLSNNNLCDKKFDCLAECRTDNTNVVFIEVK